MSFPLKILFILTKRAGNVYYFIISLIMLINTSISPYSSWIFITLLAITIMVNIIIEFWLDSKRKVNDVLINDQMATV